MRHTLKTAKEYIIRRPLLVFLLVLVSYLLVTTYYMYPVVRDINHTTYGFGDNTAGPIWRFGVSNNPLGGSENVTNFPYGESLYSPVWFSTLFQALPLWALSQVITPVAAYNTFNIVGFVFTALMMYGLVNYLTKGKKWVAWLAGFAVSFAPYFQTKVGGHPSYGYAGFFIGIIWLFLLTVQSPRRRFYALSLGALTGVSFYFDPYFTLLTAIALLALTLGWIIYRYCLYRSAEDKLQSLKESKQTFKKLILSALTVILLLIPLLGVRILKAQEIDTQVSAARGNVLAEAKACSNLPHEYLLPFVLHPGYQFFIGKDRYTKTINTLGEGFSCGIGEDSVGISLAILAIGGIGSVVLLWELFNKRKLPKNMYAQSGKYLLISFAVLGIAAAVMALPPVKFHGIPTPSRIMIDLTSTWRTLARFYVLVNIAAVLIAAMFMVYFGKVFDKLGRSHLKVLLFIPTLLFVVFEYQAFAPLKGNPLGTFSYKNDAPAVYTWLHGQNDIKAIAEYPIERYGGESDAMSYYLTMQQIHGKKLFNSALSYSSDELLKSGMKDLSDPQTINILRSLGVNAVVVHGVDPELLKNLPGTELVYQAAPAKFNLGPHTPLVKYNDVTAVLRLAPLAQKQQSLIALESGFARNTDVIESAINWDYETLDGAELSIQSLNKASKTTPLSVCFDIKMATEGDIDTVRLLKDGHLYKEASVTDQYQRVAVPVVASKLVLNDVSGHNMRIRNVGCVSGEVQ